MGQHHHSENPWRVRVDDANGTVCGAGVLLDDRHVLTCAHVVRDAGAADGSSASYVRVASVACRPGWTRTARVVPGSWVHKEGTERGDVALLQLDEPADCGTRTALWRVPLSGGTVSIYGFPRTSETSGMNSKAELAGSGGKEAERGILFQVSSDHPWIQRGYSGAGVVVEDGEFGGRVIGIVVADYVDGGARAAWMLPTETIETYLPQIAPFIHGSRTNDLEPSGAVRPDDVLADSLRLALTQELTRLFGGEWSGTVVVGTGAATGAGISWLLRLVGTADPAARSRMSDSELTGAPEDTVLGLGTIDAAYDARGKSVSDLRRYLVDRFGLPGGDDDEVVYQLLHRRPPASLVVGGVDRAADPDALIRALLGPLAARADARGVRLALAFEGHPPAGLSYEVSLDPTPLAAVVPVSNGVTAEAAEAAVRQLAAEEEAATRLRAKWGLAFRAAPSWPTAWAPRLRVRLAVARSADLTAELAAIQARAAEARGEVTRTVTIMHRMIATRDDLRKFLELHRVRAARHFGDEDQRLGVFYASAARELRTPPTDLATAQKRVNRYVEEVNRRIQEGRGHGPG
jgi:hypothetical protein